jgi:hypothetical protein
MILLKVGFSERAIKQGRGFQVNPKLIFNVLLTRIEIIISKQ